jgi:hypothetical protein
MPPENGGIFQNQELEVRRSSRTILKFVRKAPVNAGCPGCLFGASLPAIFIREKSWLRFNVTKEMTVAQQAECLRPTMLPARR